MTRPLVGIEQIETRLARRLGEVGDADDIDMGELRAVPVEGGAGAGDEPGIDRRIDRDGIGTRCRLIDLVDSEVGEPVGPAAAERIGRRREQGRTDRGERAGGGSSLDHLPARQQHGTALPGPVATL